jgi:hypothetical protein
MEIEVKPRKKTDRGGYLCMPLCKNVPEGKPEWKKVSCPICGEMCWERPGQAGIIEKRKLDGAFCTECALKVATKERMHQS